MTMLLIFVRSIFITYIRKELPVAGPVDNKKKRGKTMKEKTQNAGRGASLAMGVAFVGFTTQFGLIPLVKTGYSYIGYATLIVIVIPIIVHMIVGCVKKQPVMGSEAAEN